eukprot:1894118-Alexandrium_andersonii.AAC.1
MASASSFAGANPWEEPGYSEAEEATADPNSDPGAAGIEFVEGLLDLYLASKISAQHLCTSCWWAWKGGIQGPAPKYALRPGQSSGNYQRHLDRVLGFSRLKGDL